MRFFLFSLILLLIGLHSPIHFGQTANSFLIRDVRVFDGQRVLERRTVVVTGEKITQVTEATNVNEGQIIQGEGRTLFPGLFDGHVHVSEDINGSLRQALAFGVTTVLDMFTAGDQLRRLKQVENEDPSSIASLRTSGVGATVPGGHPTELGFPSFPFVTRPEQAQTFVDARIAEGSDYIKIIYDDNVENHGWPTLNTETLRALVQAAHKRAKLAVVHTLTEEKAREAIAAGVDGIVHLFVGEAASSDFGRFAASHHVFVMPTLSTLQTVFCGKPLGPSILADPLLKPYIAAEFYQALQVPPDPDRNHFCNATAAAMHQLVAAQVPIIAGTDTPVPGTTYGASLHGELELLVQAGLTPGQALAAATSVPAQQFQISDRGFIRPGMRADLVLVEGDPTRNILATRRIVQVWKRGVPVQRSTR
jgi:imidazolonepropionase-like amidohydrolase